MQLNEQLGTDRGVSPVIAVILMVAITVILSAVIGSFVLDIGGSLNDSPPQATFEAEQNTIDVPEQDQTNPGHTELPVVNLTHVGGESVASEHIKVTLDGIPVYGQTFDVADYYPNEDGSPKDPDYLDVLRPFATAEEVSAGDSFTLIFADGEVKEIGLESTEVHLEVHGGGSPDGVWWSHSRGHRFKDDVTLLDSGTLRVIYESPDGNAQILSEYEIK